MEGEGERRENKEDEPENETQEQKDTEEGANNGETSEDIIEKKNGEDGTQDGGLDGAQMDISSTDNIFIPEVESVKRKTEHNKDTDSEGEAQEELEKDKVETGLTRRRSFKVKPNVKATRKKALKTSLGKSFNRYKVLEDLEEDE
ncbi:hypothetical protein DPEC_G00126660 [Dallia pectoralis]|uniref:Uncharacterized protein n=1 Tax=Dallia pectoralis TaxID=75939 RepID=A0ACC2GRJ3_DALPE|nr:hypothetical protein DPEC_G00126660 [Dallia pectoralis]